MKIIKIFSIIVAILAAGLAAQLSMPVEAQPSRQAECSFAGVWSTSYGQMTLDQLGNVVNGTYGTERRVQGTVLEGLLTGSWSHPPTYSAENNQAGDIEFLISANCESFEGSWRYGSTGSWTNWNGTLSQRGEG